ncbi:hypothetical protein EJ04DRAFT_508390 [Polyplosphaeria fusca]|uniref:Uncharacterized protein n=1 Tax=Polyplosphaeria fusca TaxID=682080 RepID=A0A9P4RB01_9PLEO|nr:hypothetical protein EJ04DRAFT_508390 [Polyplosphaeria fusca]
MAPYSYASLPRSRIHSKHPLPTPSTPSPSRLTPHHPSQTPFSHRASTNPHPIPDLIPHDTVCSPATLPAHARRHPMPADPFLPTISARSPHSTNSAHGAHIHPPPKRLSTRLAQRNRASAGRPNEPSHPLATSPARAVANLPRGASAGAHIKHRDHRARPGRRSVVGPT